ncbi:hypothetical protein ANN_24637 [Periplaneta americana]|uniref:Uncharacterized protein n=1 Tax=Periplaneta americana TaxID=6978 RepID=A0ABQ8S3K2_PERAM|nr:hypothetical protein ANN_24637 [Periplaneta americana]
MALESGVFFVQLVRCLNQLYLQSVSTVKPATSPINSTPFAGGDSLGVFSRPHLWSSGQRVWPRNQVARVRIPVVASYLVEVLSGVFPQPNTTWFRQIKEPGLSTFYKDKQSECGIWLRSFFGLTYLDPMEIDASFERRANRYSKGVDNNGIRQTVTVNGERYYSMLQNFVIPRLRNHDMENIIFISSSLLLTLNSLHTNLIRVISCTGTSGTWFSYYFGCNKKTETLILSLVSVVFLKRPPALNDVSVARTQSHKTDTERIPNLTGEQSDGITVFRIPPMTSLMLHRCRTGAINLQSRHDSIDSSSSFVPYFRCNVTSLMPPDR